MTVSVGATERIKPPPTSRRDDGGSLLSRAYPVVLGVLLFLFLWVVIDELVRNPGFPAPLGVWRALLSSLSDPVLYESLAISGRRIVVAWSLSYLLGVTWGLIASRTIITDGLARPWILIGLALPSPVAVLFSILLFGLSEATALLGLVLVTAPFIANIIDENVKARLRALFEMSSSFGFTGPMQMRHVMLPFLAPGLFASARLGLQLTWKEVVVMESIARADGMGERLEYFYRVLRPEYMLAWTVIFGAIMLFVEFCLIRSISRYVFRWRRRAKVA